MAIICMKGLPGKIGKCVNTDPPHLPGTRLHARATADEGEAYPNFFVDISIIDFLHQAAKSISDTATRAALQGGIDAAVKAVIKRAGNEGISITLTD